MRLADGGGGRGALLAPALIFIVGWWLLPALATVVVTLVDDGASAVVDNLRFVVSDGAARQAIRNTLLWVVGTAVGATTFGLLLAWLADRLRAGRLFASVMLVPAFVAPVVVAVAWRATLAFRPPSTDQVGLVNAVLGVAGLNPVAWLTQAPLNTLLLAGALVWMQTGVAMLILSAAVAKVPDDIRDAARTDGATEAQVFGRITVPNIRGAIAVAGLSSVVVAVRVFDLVKVATDGQFATSVLGTEMFDQAFVHDRSGQGAILAVLMAALVAPVIFLAVRRIRGVSATDQVSADPRLPEATP